MNNCLNEKEYILEEKLFIVNLLLLTLKNNVIQVKKLCKDNKDIQLKMLDVRTEILKIEDRIEDILDLNNINTVKDINEASSRFSNLINEESLASSTISSNNLIEINKTSINAQKDIHKSTNTKELTKEELEEKTLRKWFEEMIKEEEEEFRSHYSQEIEEMENAELEENKATYHEYLDCSFEEYKKEYKEFCSLIATENIETLRKEYFEKYRTLRETGSIKITFCDDKKGNVRIYSKYDFSGLIKSNRKEELNVSKRQLPTVIFDYLICNKIIKNKDLELFSKNRFGRTFESKMGDIIKEKDLPSSPSRQKRYNKKDYSSIETIDINEPIYISNQWDENSISKFIDYVRKEYNDYILIVDPHKKLIEEIKSNNINSPIGEKYIDLKTGKWTYNN